ncbi:hypothetical protein LXD69_06825 [Flavobacterium sediminilitoris]|uniref:Bacteriocin-type signal sequence-containing protein n=1 Tax=Flavobacterium sediminilitoris TaxID=2024526 RepID=A0ABY4HR89_9FLAO|nr:MULTISPECIES: hypothetical protein [Flavobacterium]UOX35223.1 hypothetical protein LXD69_06825 [Flavobacterium sediminilitoris]
MKKTVLNLKGTKELSSNEQKQIQGGVIRDWDKCCIKPDSPPYPPYGCEYWKLCAEF